MIGILECKTPQISEHCEFNPTYLYLKYIPLLRNIANYLPLFIFIWKKITGPLGQLKLHAFGDQRGLYYLPLLIFKFKVFLYKFIPIFLKYLTVSIILSNSISKLTPFTNPLSSRVYTRGDKDLFLILTFLCTVSNLFFF